MFFVFDSWHEFQFIFAGWKSPLLNVSYFVKSRWRKLKRLFEDESWRQALKLRRKYREIATWQLICGGDHEINASVTHVMDQNPALILVCLSSFTH